LKKIIVILTLLPLFSIAQEYTGSIIDRKSNLPIKNVNIKLKLLNINSTSDENGGFILNTTAQLKKNDTLYFSHISYATKKISFEKLKENNFLIFLDENIEQLENVTLPLSTNKSLKQKISFKKLTPPKYALSNSGAILKDNKIYVIGGDASFKTDAWKKIQNEKADPTMEDYIRELNFQYSGQKYNGNLMIYDIITNQWEISSTKFRKRAYHNINEHNKKIYVLGGKSISTNAVFEYLDNKIEVFDIEKQTIIIDNTNPHQAAEFVSFTYNNNLIMIGGSIKMDGNGIKKYSNKVHSYDINSGYWYELNDMPIAKETSGILINNKIYLFGGSNGKPLSTIESFDLINEKWKTEGNLFLPLENPAITSKNDLVYLFENEKLYTYDVNTKEQKEYLIDLPMKSSKLFYYDNKLYLLGGYIENYYSKFPSPNLFSIDINEFSNTKPNKVTAQ
jgi:hypothetical protein